MGMPHLKLDIYDVPEDLLSDETLIYDLLNALPRAIDMQIVSGPHVYPFVHKRSGSDTPEHYTLDGLVIIATSHVAIHTLPHRQMCLVDVFSCKQFDRQEAIDTICAVFGIEPSSIDQHFTERATRSPREALLA